MRQRRSWGTRLDVPRVPGLPCGGRQSFVHTLSACWRRPSLTALEVVWRWAYGVPAFALVAWQVRGVLMAATGGTLDPARLGLDKALLNDPVGALSADPLGAAGKFNQALGMVLPGLTHAAVWVLPMLLVAWVVMSSLGRTVVLQRADAALHARLGTLMVLQAIRMATLAAIVWVWYAAIEWSGRFAIVGPMATGEEPNLILYCAMVIVLSLGIFTAWAFVSWYLSVAPLLAMLKNLGPLASLAAASRVGVLKTKLVEVNLIMGIVKICADRAGDGVFSDAAAVSKRDDAGVSGMVVGRGDAAVPAVVGFLPGGTAGGVSESVASVCAGRRGRAAAKLSRFGR